jgi:hypothetical protein
MCVARIDSIRFLRDGKVCSRENADSYQLILSPIISTGDITWYKEDGKEYRRTDGPPGNFRLTAKTKKISRVKNVVRLNASA